MKRSSEELIIELNEFIIYRELSEHHCAFFPLRITNQKERRSRNFLYFQARSNTKR